MQRWLRERPVSLMALLAAGLAFAGLTPMADNVTQRVLEHVNQISWGQIFFPYYLEVAEAPGIRPLSLVALKLYISAYGPVASPPMWLYFVKGFLGIFCFGLAARSWLRAVGFERQATLAAITAMAMRPSLFVAWHFMEYDNFTGAAALFAMAQIMRPGPLGAGRWAVAVIAVLFAALTKESGALLFFAFAAAGALVTWKRGQKVQARRHVILFATAAAACMIFALQIMFQGVAGDHGELPAIFRLIFVFHNTDQMVYLATPFGALVLFVWGWRARAHLAPLAAGALTLALLVAPLHAVYSHYETFYFTPPWIITFLGFGLVYGLYKRATPLSLERPEAMVAVYLLMTLATFGAAALLSPAAREDLATRLFLGLAPLLHAAFFAALADLWARGKTQEGRVRRGLTRAGLMLNGAAFGWFVVVGAVNFAIEWNTFHRIEHEAKSRMAAESYGESNVLFNHLVMFLGPQELKTHGATDLEETDFFIAGDWLPELALPEVPWPVIRDLEADWKRGKKTMVFWFGMRSNMSASANEQLEMDFKWSHLFPLGILNPFDYLGHNMPEDMRMTTYRPGPTALEWLSETRGEARFRLQLPTWRLPEFLTEIPQRVLRGIPLLESYTYTAKFYVFDPPDEKASGGEKPKVRKAPRADGKAVTPDDPVR